MPPDPPRELLLTPFVTALSYDYYDDTFKKWTTETTLRNGTANVPIAPQRLRLTFAYAQDGALPDNGPDSPSPRSAMPDF